MSRPSGWEMRSGSWWMWQWTWTEYSGIKVPFSGWLSVGVHVDLKRRFQQDIGYGPYIDLHLGIAILSLGRNPKYSSAYHRVANFARGGVVIQDSDCN